jgi:hypothetical protein
MTSGGEISPRGVHVRRETALVLDFFNERLPKLRPQFRFCSAPLFVPAGGGANPKCFNHFRDVQSLMFSLRARGFGVQIASSLLDGRRRDQYEFGLQSRTRGGIRKVL